MKSQTTEWETTLVNHISDNGHVSKIHEELL